MKKMTRIAFRYSLPVLKIYSIRNVHCRFSVRTVNIETQPTTHAQFVTSIWQVP